MHNICIIRNTFNDRSSFLKLSLEYQQSAIQPTHAFPTFIFLDPHPEYGLSKSYNDEYINKFPKIVFENYKNRMSWYLATKYMFDNYQFDYILSIEDDVLISKDYLLMCEQVVKDDILNKKENALYFHIGAWEEPTGDPNKIVYSGASSRSILINRNKFSVIQDHMLGNTEHNPKIGNDAMITQILKSHNMRTIAPKCNRHAHIGIYGWSSNGVHADNRGKSSVFDNGISDNELYLILKRSCLHKNKLLELNQQKNPQYFWDFNPDINFTQLVYQL